MLGTWAPADLDTCTEDNFLYGEDSCGDPRRILGMKLVAFIIVAVILFLCCCVVLPVVVVECRKRRAEYD